MTRLLVFLCALFLCLGAAPAFAQTDPEDPDSAAVPEETVTPDDEIVDEEEVIEAEQDGEEDPYETPGCEGVDGTDGDYTYCGCDADAVGTEGDYVYCSPSAGGGDPRARLDGKEKDDDTGAGGTVEAAQALPRGSLPATGGHPVVIALIGLAFVLIGSGGRLRLGRP